MDDDLADSWTEIFPHITLDDQRVDGKYNTVGANVAIYRVKTDVFNF